MEEKVVTEQVKCPDNSDNNVSSKKRREEKIRKRDSKSWENIYKSISNLPEAEKIDVVSKKYSELYDEFRKVSQNGQNLEKSCVLLQKEKEHIRSEQAKSILARSRLENLCRELQKQNKQIKEENITKLKEEEERRKEVAAKFQKTLDELTSIMNENSEKNFKLRDDNIDMSNKISQLYSEFQKREEDIKRMTKQMELEKQLSKARITKLEFELKAERELWSKERDILQKNLEQSEARNKQLLENIKGMEEHLSVYKGQYEDFESTLDKSNKIFDNCKSEMVKMSKHIVALEKEVNNWKSKWQSSATSLIELSTAKQTQDLHLAAADKKIEQLQKLCRQLQVDRAAFLKLLKSNGIEPVSQACVENPEKPPTPKERELVILKDSLKMLQEQLQDQLKTTTNSGSEHTESNESKMDNKSALNVEDTETINVLVATEVNSIHNIEKPNLSQDEREMNDPVLDTKPTAQNKTLNETICDEEICSNDANTINQISKGIPQPCETDNVLRDGILKQKNITIDDSGIDEIKEEKPFLHQVDEQVSKIIELDQKSDMQKEDQARPKKDEENSVSITEIISESSATE